MITVEQVVALLKRHRQRVVVRQPIIIWTPETMIDAQEEFDLRFVAQDPKQSDNVQAAP